MRFAAEAARTLPRAEIVELHADSKLDAPSGTARATAARMGGEVPIHSVRFPRPRRAPGGDPGRTGADAHDPARYDLAGGVRARRAAGDRGVRSLPPGPHGRAGGAPGGVGPRAPRGAREARVMLGAPERGEQLLVAALLVRDLLGLLTTFHPRHHGTDRLDDEEEDRRRGRDERGSGSGDESAVAEHGVVDREREVRKSGLPMIMATIGITRLFTRELTSAPNATPRTNATARSTMLPFIRKSLNSLSITPPFCELSARLRDPSAKSGRVQSGRCSARS